MARRPICYRCGAPLVDVPGEDGEVLRGVMCADCPYPGEILRETIRRRREEAGLSLSGLGEALGVDRQTIWRWEVGEQEPKGLYLRRVVEWLTEEARRGRPPHA